MAKIRVHELAKELGVDSKEVIDFLGGELKAASGLEDEEAMKVRKKFAPKPAAKQAASVEKPEKPAAKAEKPAVSAAKPAAAPAVDKSEKPAASTGEKAVKPAAPKAEKPAEKAADTQASGEKKKPVFLFRPENAKLNGTKNVAKTLQGNASRPQGARPAGDKPSRPSQTFTPNSTAPTGEKRQVIKPTVPKTAEMYKENASEGPRKIVDTTDVARKIRKEEEAKRAAEEAAVRAAAEAERIAEETKKAEEIAKKQAELLAKHAAAEAAKKAEEAAAASVDKPEETSKPAAPVEKKPAPQEKKPQETQERKPAAPKAPEGTEDRKPQDGEKKKLNFVFSKNTRETGTRPQGGYQGRDGQSGYQNRDGQGFRPREGQGQGGYQNRQGQGGYQNRDGQGFRPRDGQGQGGYRQGQGQGGFQNRQGQSQGGYRQGQGQGGYRQGQGQGGNAFGAGKGGNQGNRGIFSDSNRSGNSNIRFNKDNAGGGSASLSKTDVHGGKKNVKTDRDKGNYDRSGAGKKAENFKNLSKDGAKKNVKKEEEVIKMITLPEIITMKELAERMKQKPADLIKKQFLQGKMYTVNSELSYEEAEAIALDYEILCEKEVQVDVIEELLKEEAEDEKSMKKRPPVVCVMGHVDHGKTSLLDAIRATHVTDREAGGITQHIGAYMVECNGEPITFLDTPGHEAFTAMRMRGAQATDIAVLVVAADDGVMPQTVEAINHAKAAGVEVIVAVNKIDKPAADIDRVKNDLSKYELIPEEWGGSTMFVPVSAKMHQNIDDLLERILLVAEVLELRANPNREMRGLVIEAKLDKGRGPVATVLVQKGTLKAGDFVSCGSFYGRVRAMLDADGNQMKSATPSMPVEILGLNGVPNAGEVCIGHKNEKDARSYAETFIAEEKKKMLAETKKRLTMDSLFAEIQAGNVKELPIVVKADVQGSVEAVRTSLEKLSNEEVAVKVIHGGVGAISESDVSLASASNAIIIGFNVKPDQQAKQLAESENVDLKLYRVIYQAIDDVEAAMKGMLAPVYEEKILGHAEVRQTFKASGVGVIAGSYVTDGTLERGCQVRMTRAGEELYDGPLVSLKRFKDDVKEVREGYECGIVLEKFNDIQEGDIFEAYKMVQVERT